jgi:O-antigen/teichoic acid export membrane protein
MPSQINQKTVAKNTLMLYIRMGVMMIVSLYTSRVVLATLGVDDFGIYNVVAGVIVMFSFMNLTLTVAIRRYLSYELGQEKGGRIQKVYNASIIAVFIASVIIVFGLETIGYWFLNYKLNIPYTRLDSANFVFQFSILSFFFNMNLVPYSSAIVSYERMGVYAYLGIAETLLKLGLVLSLPFLPGDKLKWYGLLIASLSIFIAFCNFIYCTLRVIRPKMIGNFMWTDVFSIFRFSSWTVLGTMIFMLATQGVNMIYNVFFGVAINAALGIAQHVANAANQFVGNFQTAFNPQLTKSYSAEGLSESTFNFVCQTSRLSILLILIIGVPIICNVSPILDLWLEVVPDYAVPFTVIFILYMAIDGASGPLYYLVYAKGNLKMYQIVLGAIQIGYVVLVYCLCFIGVGPTYVLSLNVVTSVVIYVARLIILKRLMNFPIHTFSEKVIVPLCGPIMLFVIMGYANNLFCPGGSLLIIFTKIGMTIFIVSLVSFYYYLNKEERQFVYSLIKR